MRDCRPEAALLRAGGSDSTSIVRNASCGDLHHCTVYCVVCVLKCSVMNSRSSLENLHQRQRDSSEDCAGELHLRCCMDAACRLGEHAESA